jgi:hypothetical protein
MKNRLTYMDYLPETSILGLSAATQSTDVLRLELCSTYSTTILHFHYYSCNNSSITPPANSTMPRPSSPYNNLTLSPHYLTTEAIIG